MATVVISASNVANYPEGGGHFWVYMQYALGLRRLGCEVYWLENSSSKDDSVQAEVRIAEFMGRMEQFGLGEKVILYRDKQETDGGCAPREFIGISPSEAKAILHRADLLLNFHYAIDPALLTSFRRTALVDIDPGLLQIWISTGQLAVPRHDLYVTTGETVGSTSAPFSDCGLQWHCIRPPVCLERWPYTYDLTCDTFTTVSSWWTLDWVRDAQGALFDNNKRVTFMQFVDLPQRTSQVLELALCFGTKPHDLEDWRILEQHGWKVRHAHDVARTPEMYQAFIQKSRGEFSCAKPTCMMLQNGWVSDRTLCYLASGKPVVVQNTGPSSCLPNGEGAFRFSTIEDAVCAFEAINSNYERHCRAAREIVEAHFDSKRIMERILNLALHSAGLVEPAALLDSVGGKVGVSPQIDEH